MITSISGIFGTGEKKCIPTTFSGRFACAAMSVIGSDEVFDAKMASSRVAASNSARTLRLSVRSSKTASMAMSTVRHPSNVVPPLTCWRRRVASGRPSVRSWPVKYSWTALRPFPRQASSRSLNLTTYPLSEATWAMPLPMNPAPRTPILRTARGETSAPFSLFASRMAKKRPMSPFAMSLEATSPKSSASRLKPSATFGSSTAARIASRAFSGAG